ncbi:unnamed protein product [Acanthosepion pharaonis]|uniref:Uncharacterized protein n=1 Tax=Acanthosepion pharaonis TaxID=158019 RepID=A0A812EDJ8_ACAPH|nr:unnamed protein product [Sepia pharaonis]
MSTQFFLSFYYSFSFFIVSTPHFSFLCPLFYHYLFSLPYFLTHSFCTSIFLFITLHFYLSFFFCFHTMFQIHPPVHCFFLSFCFCVRYYRAKVQRTYAALPSCSHFPSDHVYSLLFPLLFPFARFSFFFPHVLNYALRLLPIFYFPTLNFLSFFTFFFLSVLSSSTFSFVFFSLYNFLFFHLLIFLYSLVPIFFFLFLGTNFFFLHSSYSIFFYSFICFLLSSSVLLCNFPSFFSLYFILGCSFSHLFFCSLFFPFPHFSHLFPFSFTPYPLLLFICLLLPSSDLLDDFLSFFRTSHLFFFLLHLTLLFPHSSYLICLYTFPHSLLPSSEFLSFFLCSDSYIFFLSFFDLHYFV